MVFWILNFFISSVFGNFEWGRRFIFVEKGVNSDIGLIYFIILNCNYYLMSIVFFCLYFLIK